MNHRDNKMNEAINYFLACAIFNITKANIDVNFQKRLCELNFINHKSVRLLLFKLKYCKL